MERGSVSPHSYDPQRCRSESSWWRTAARSPCGSSAPVASSGSRPSRWLRPTTAAPCTPAPRTRRSRSRATSSRRSTSGRRSRPAPTRSTPATASSPRTPTSRRRSRRPGSSGSALRPRRSGSAATSSPRRGSPPRRAFRSSPPASRTRSAFRSSSRRRRAAAAEACAIVREPGELDEALAAAAREAEAAFGDGTVFCERYVERPRHVEIQLLADSHGTVLALGERDCSVQRRHQKVLEESPSPALDPELRASMSAAAVAFARAIGYTSAGTAEFMLADGEFFFLELNGRIQVEHPVTELVAGVDLVREQIRVADGERLEPSNRLLQGHAVEVRLYAEDPRTFLPQAGTVERLRLPTGVRVDAGVAEGRRGRARVRPDDREADRARADARRGVRSARRRARRDRGRRRDDEPPLPPLARRASRRPCGRGDDGVPDRAPATLRAAAPPSGRPLAGRLAAEPAAGGACARSRRRQRRARPCRRRRGEQGDRAHAGHGDQRRRRARRPGRGAPPAARARGDEDGDAARRRPTTRRSRPCTSRRATASPAAPSSSSWKRTSRSPQRLRGSVRAQLRQERTRAARRRPAAATSSVPASSAGRLERHRDDDEYEEDELDPRDDVDPADVSLPRSTRGVTGPTIARRFVAPSAPGTGSRSGTRARSRRGRDDPEAPKSTAPSIVSRIAERRATSERRRDEEPLCRASPSWR